MAGWIGVDLDGTLARYEGWRGPDHVGEPVPLMLARIKRWLSEGKDVRIFTARVAKDDDEAIAATNAIDAWCIKHLGMVLPITCRKDYEMAELWDDCVVQVVPNTGERVDGK
jgi:hypothetical protein